MKPKQRCPVTGRYVKEDRLVVELKISKPIASLKRMKNVLSAKYGIEGRFINVDPGLVIRGRKVSNRLAGSDPAPRVKKKLIFVMNIEGEEITREINEGDIVEY